MTPTVSAAQRFTARNPCPICGGHAGLPNGRGVRCYGFLGTDGKYAHCTRAEYAGKIEIEPDSDTFAHRLDVPCRCGKDHGTGPLQPNGHHRNGAHHKQTPRKHIRERRWTITHIDGEPIEHVRIDYDDGSKRLFWQRGGHNGLGGLAVADLPLYGIDCVAGAKAVIVVEGEGARDAVDPLARELGMAVVATVTGAGGNNRPSDAVLGAIPPVLVFLWPDSDAHGEQHMRAIATALLAMGRSPETVRRVVWSDARPGAGDDGADFVRVGTVEKLGQMIDDAPVWEGEPRADASESDAGRESREDGAALLDAVETFIGRFVAYPSEHARVTHTLWIAHTHAMDAWDSTPRLAFLSPEPASGKTRGLEVTEPLVPQPVEAVNVTAAYLFRKVDDPAGAPTILFDEIDTVFGPKAREHEDVRGLLNAGHRKGAVAGRCVVRGKAVETVEYPAYCAVAMAGLGDLPDTILTRSVVIRMRRRSLREKVEPFRRRLVLAEGHALRDRLAAWVSSVNDHGGFAWPNMPDGVEDRDADVWEPLLSVADAVGGEWPQRARAAAVAFVVASKDSTPSLGVRLLADLRTVFRDRDAMSTEAILAALHALEESPWSEIVAGKPLNARGLARRLGGYGITPQTVRIGDKTPRGYRREDLADAWERYLPSVAAVVDSTADREETSLSLREGATSTTAATAIAVVSPDGQPIPDDGVGFGQSAGARDGAAVADVLDVADFLEDGGKPKPAPHCVDCSAPLPDRWLGHYCARHGGRPPDGADKEWAHGEEGIL